jgi:ABC-type polysaccharide/polyol phosphate export permease
MMSNKLRSTEVRPAVLSPGQAAWRDLTGSFASWRIWYLLGTNDARQRYRRSRIGQFWITINVGVFVLCVGVINAKIFNANISEYIPAFCVSYILWIFISGMLNDATMVFVQAEGILRQEPLPRLVLVHRLILRNLVVLAHNALIIPVVFIAFGTAISPLALLALPGLVLAILVGSAMSILIGIACTRFRDLSQVVGNLVTLLFFASPIMWRPGMLPRDMAWLVDYNPVAVLIRLIGEPIMGMVPAPLLYLQGLLTAMTLLTMAAMIFTRFRARIVYWL